MDLMDGRKVNNSPSQWRVALIVGFHGRADEFLDAIGVYLKPFIPFCASSPGYTMHQEVWSL
jgi:hypothetical protein